MTYLVAHPPARSQFRTIRRAPSWHPNGSVVTAIVVHTAESVIDLVGVDTGAENVARFISRRPDPGSYHSIVDSDSTVWLVPYGAESYGEGTGGNRWALHLAFAMRAEDWPLDRGRIRPTTWWYEALERAAHEANNMRSWAAAETGIVIPARRITESDYRNGARGFVGHGDIDPDRRHDPGERFPWDYFLQLVEDLSDGDHMTETEIEQWQQNLVDRGYGIGSTGPNGDGVDGDFGAATLEASRAVLSGLDTAEDALVDAETEREMLAARLADCQQSLAHDFTAADAVVGRATRQWFGTITAAGTPNDIVG